MCKQTSKKGHITLIDELFTKFYVDYNWWCLLTEEKNHLMKNEFGGWKPQVVHAGGISVDARPKRATQAQLGTTEATEHLHRDRGP